MSTVQPWRSTHGPEQLRRAGALLAGAQAIIVVPPAALVSRPSLSAHLLQACARAGGHETKAFYASLSFANWVGKAINLELCSTDTEYLVGERLFAAAAYGVELLGANAAEALAPFFGDPERPRREKLSLDFDALRELAAEVEAWISDIAAALAASDAAVIGCTSIFEQTAAAVAILTRVKELAPHKITIIGGANCIGEMGDGVSTLDERIDYVFSGEGEEGFVRFLDEVGAGRRPAQRVLHGLPVQNLDALPVADYDDFYDQLAILIDDPPANDRQWLPFESSRGCWWGRKHTCTFCGLNGDTLELYRQKSPAHVLSELRTLLSRYPPRKVMAYDNIMPHTYYRTVLPDIAREFTGCTFFFEQKANISLEQMCVLKRAHFDLVQPGIESLNSNLLRLMRKGVSASQNIAVLRYGRSCLVSMYWNLLYGFPGDEAADYEAMIEILPLLRHLSPPSKLGCINLDRFSPYFMSPEEFGIVDVEPIEAYRDVLPPHADVRNIAYKFRCRYDSGVLARPDIVAALERETLAWRLAWLDSDDVYTLRLNRTLDGPLGDTVPQLWVEPDGEGTYVLTDTRGIPGTQRQQRISHAQASVALSPRRASHFDRDEPEIAWALDNRVAVDLDGMFVPLAVTEPGLLAEFETEAARLRILRPAASAEAGAA